MRCLSILFLCCFIASANAETMHKGYEIPKYQVLKSEGAVELRRYEQHLVAEYTTQGSRSSAVGKGFRALAGYIFGKNESGEKIAMTAPVSQLQSDDGWLVRFMVPNGRDKESLPVPNNADVRFLDFSQNTQLVIRFSGLWRDGKMREQAELLRKYARDNALTLKGEPMFYYYDDPTTLPWNRRNEVAYLVADPKSP